MPAPTKSPLLIAAYLALAGTVHAQVAERSDDEVWASLSTAQLDARAATAEPWLRPARFKVSAPPFWCRPASR